MLYMEGLATYSGHVSVRDPERDRAHVNSHAAARGEIRPEHVVAITLDGDPVDPDAPRPVSERAIHAAIYREREDVGAVVHVHPPHATLFAVSGTDLLPVHVRGSILTDGAVPVFDRPILIRDREDAEAMVEAMDGQKQVLLRSHGAVVADETIERAFARAIYLEMNAYYQHEASDLGNPNPLTPEEVTHLNDQNWSDRVVEKFWHFYEWKATEEGYLPEEW